jgi:Uma2 family endonuclease
LSGFKKGEKMPLAKKTDTKVSTEEYLTGELVSDIKYEYIDGVVYAMAGASTKHNLISSNILSELKNKLKQKKSSCDVFSSDMKVRINNTTTSFFYPDVMVVCDINNNDDYFQNSPIIIVEILSKSTRKNDKSIKKLAYFNIPTLQEYVILEQDYCEVEVFRKKAHWSSTSYFLGDQITFKSIETTLSVEDIYYHINNEDMLDYLKENEAEE